MIRIPRLDPTTPANLTADGREGQPFVTGHEPAPYRPTMIFFAYQAINPLPQEKPQSRQAIPGAGPRMEQRQGNRNMRTRRPSNLLCDERGATAIEYGLIAALISLACIIAFQMLGLSLESIFTTIDEALNR